MQPFILFIQKNKLFNWDKKYKDVFCILKNKMTTALVLKYFDFTKPAILKMDFSNYINSGILF